MTAIMTLMGQQMLVLCCCIVIVTAAADLSVRDRTAVSVMNRSRCNVPNSATTDALCPALMAKLSPATQAR
jgi:hypothetical protein